MTPLLAHFYLPYPTIKLSSGNNYDIAFNNVSLLKSKSLMTLTEVCSVVPEAFLLLSILFLILYGIFLGSHNSLNYPLTQNAVIYLSSLTLALTFALIYLLQSSTSELTTFNSTIAVDSLSLGTKKCLLLTCMLCLLVIKQDLTQQKINSFEYVILLLLSLFGAALMSSSNDLLTAYLAIEVQSLSFYLLASFKKNSAFSINAGLKYFILGALGSSTFLFGASLIYGVTGTTNFEQFHNLYAHEYTHLTHSLETTPVLQFGLVLVLASLFFKLAIAPFHIWSPDVYEGSVSSSTFFFSVIPKLGLFVLIVRLFHHSFEVFVDKFRYLLVFSAVLSIFTGSFGGLDQKRLKTLLAYSSIGHMGFALLAFSSGVAEGVQVMYGYLLVYMLSGISLWAIFFSTKMKYATDKHSKELSDFSSLTKSNNVLAVFLVVVFLSLAGFPPFVGFYAKMSVFTAAVEASMYFVTIFAILCSVVSTYYYIRIIKISYFEQTTAGNLYLPLNRSLALIITTGCFLIVWLFINPNTLYLFCHNVSLFGSTG